MHSPAQLSLLEDAMEELRKFEGELKVKSSLLSSLRIDVSSAESLSKLKGRCSHCHTVSHISSSIMSDW